MFRPRPKHFALFLLVGCGRVDFDIVAQGGDARSAVPSDAPSAIDGFQADRPDELLSPRDSVASLPDLPWVIMELVPDAAADLRPVVDALTADNAVDLPVMRQVDAPLDVVEAIRADVSVDSADATPDVLPVSSIGCADQQREAFTSTLTHPNIAGCSGGFSRPGVVGGGKPMCGRMAGDDSNNVNGTGCGPHDLCAVGWHICLNRLEVMSKSPTGCTGVIPVDATEPLFFATAQTSIGSNECNDLAMGTNDLFGCGSLGGNSSPSCLPLDRLSSDRCTQLAPPWDCGASDGFNEGSTAIKPGPGSGGVLCCRD